MNIHSCELNFENSKMKRKEQDEMSEPKEIKAGILRLSAVLMPRTFSALITGQMKLVNKNLKLMSIRRIDGRIPFLETSYEFAFTAEDLPLVNDRLYPKFVRLCPVEGKKDCFKLEEESYGNKKDDTKI